MEFVLQFLRRPVANGAVQPPVQTRPTHCRAGLPGSHFEPQGSIEPLDRQISSSIKVGIKTGIGPVVYSHLLLFVENLSRVFRKGKSHG